MCALTATEAAAVATTATKMGFAACGSLAESAAVIQTLLCTWAAMLRVKGSLTGPCHTSRAAVQRHASSRYVHTDQPSHWHAIL
jgi:hypothetical protein